MPEAIDWAGEIERRLNPLGLPPPREAEIVEELAIHLEQQYESLLAGGASAGESRRAALAGLSGMIAEMRSVEHTAAPESLGPGSTRRQGPLPEVWRDLRYAVRVLMKSPGFTTLALLSLALGIGGNAAIFSIVSAVLIRPLPYQDPARLVRAANDGYYPPGGLVALQQRSRTMELAGFSPGLELNLTGGGEAWRLAGCSVSANFFDVLGARAEIGRGYGLGDDHPGQDRLVVLSHATWQEKFGGDPAIIGRVISLGGVDRQIVGIMPPSFAFPDDTTQFWIPLHLDSRDPGAYWARGYMPVVGRMRAGATLLQAQRETQALTRQMVTLFPFPMPRNWNAQATVVPLQQFLAGSVRGRLVVLQCAAGLVLLIACVNVASLLLARAASRHKEFAIRAALGASRGRIARQLLTESLALALAGGALGIALAFAAFSFLKASLPSDTFGLAHIQIGWEALAFAGLLALATGMVFGLAPALSALRSDLAGAIKSGGRAAGTIRTRIRGMLIVGEVALAVMLAVGAGLLIKSLWRLAHENPGFEPEHILTVRVSANPSFCRQRSACISLFGELARRATDLPGVREAAAANTVPMAADVPSVPVAVEGHPYIPGHSMWPMFWAGAVTPSYFHLMHIPILAGRGFAGTDAETAAPVAIVSAATARRYWPGQNPIGKHIRPVFDGNWKTVVGVAADVRQYDLANHSPDFIKGALYMPYAQSVNNDRQIPAAMMLIVRTGGESAALPGRIRGLVRDLDPGVPVSELRSLDSVVADSARQPRSMAWLFAAFAGAALILAAIGTYGVVSYSTAQRTFEIGMRVTLGASRGSIFSMVLGQSVQLVAAGLGSGILASLALTRMLAAFLYGTTATDAVTFLAVSGLLIAVGLLAGYVPARRAAGVDPIAALRQE